MAKDENKDEEKSGGGVMMKIIIAVVLTLVLAGGGAYGAYAAGLLGDGGDKGPDEPKFVKKGDDDPYSLADKEEFSVVYGEGGSEYRTAYYSFADSFTSNLADSPALIQTELAVSTRRDGRVLQWVKTHELAIRSAILAQLASTSEAEIYNVEGKEKLAERLTTAINDVLEENEGFGGVEAVHFRGLLVQ
ncbi:flagellar basal body-associated protein FliL [Erythrobacter sp. YT30]|uniref:flagellar basal body-associated FliL family protein n=1 Tax=Erythrobacter sp. YT30 TaxID=1735012 RepID=UPI00076D0FAF|nr:flagellar basal body-associated FliL family protein [Erythrobacter sp. YT30]KWV91687.1 flagellar basal body-associated protein FliL [Erythrobacter sp. YT30]